MSSYSCKQTLLSAKPYFSQQANASSKRCCLVVSLSSTASSTQFCLDVGWEASNTQSQGTVKHLPVYGLRFPFPSTEHLPPLNM